MRRGTYPVALVLIASLSALCLQCIAEQQQQQQQQRRRRIDHDGVGQLETLRGGEGVDIDADALAHLLNASSLDNVTCDAVIGLPNLTMQCAFVRLAPDCVRQVRSAHLTSCLSSSSSSLLLLVVVGHAHLRA